MNKQYVLMSVIGGLLVFLSVGVVWYVSTINLDLSGQEAQVSDAIPPTAPTKLSANVRSVSRVDLSWNASTDNTNVSGYIIYRNGDFYTATRQTFYFDRRLSSSLDYTYKVQAFDEVGNKSDFSSEVAVSATDRTSEDGKGKGKKNSKIITSGSDEIDQPVIENDPVVYTNTSALFTFDSNNRMVPVPDNWGEKVPDYSYAGYEGGGVAIPDVPVVHTISPGSGDDTQVIKDGIAKVKSLPIQSNGFRGALLLKAGTYEVSETIVIAHSGIVIRGEGVGREGTIIRHVRGGTDSTFSVYGGGLTTSLLTSVTDAYVPAGSDTVKVADVSGFETGQKIVLSLDHTESWAQALGLDGWNPGTVEWERVVTAVDSDQKTVTFDAPITSPIDLERGFATARIYNIDSDTRNNHIGFEDLTLISDYDQSKLDGVWPNDEAHPANAIVLTNSVNSWVRRTAMFFYSYSGIRMRLDARHNTIEDVAMFDGVSLDTPITHAGARKYYFNGGRQTLYQRVYARYGRHAFVTSGTLSGSVFLDSYSENGHLSQEPHQLWSSGILFDNMYSDSGIALEKAGLQHGWRAVGSMVWNCLSENKRWWEPQIRVEDPPEGMGNNYVVGCVTIGNNEPVVASPYGDVFGDKSHIESIGNFAGPRSLYLKQLRDRLGDSAVTSVTSNTQRTSQSAVFADLLARYGSVAEYGDPQDLSWMPAVIDMTPN